MINEDGPNRLYQNGGSPHAWLKVDVRGVESNADGIGARVQLSAGGASQFYEINGTAGFSQSSRTAHFGLGTNIQIDSLVVRWPNGRVDRRLNLAINTSLRMVEGEGIIAVEETPAPLPHAFTLQQNYPNPFNAATVIEFNIATPGLVRLVLYNTLGQEIRTLINEELTAGVRRVVWDGRDDQQTSVASGAYFYRLESGAQEQMGSMLLLR